MRRIKIIFIILILSLCSQLWAINPLVPSDFTFTPGIWGYSDASQDIRWTSYQSIGHLQILPTQWSSTYPKIYVNVTVPTYNYENETLRLINVNKPSKYFEYTLRFVVNNPKGTYRNEDITNINTMFTTGGGVGQQTQSTLDIMLLNITIPPGVDGSNQDWYGTYAGPIIIEVKETPESDPLYTMNFVLLLKFVQTSSIGDDQGGQGTIPSAFFFFVEDRPGADIQNLDYYINNQFSPIHVGRVDFGTIGTYGSNNYEIKLKPSNNQGTNFNFVKTGNTNDKFPYKVYTSKSPSSIKTDAFIVPVTNKGGDSQWQESFDVYIREINYNNTNIKAGDYTSTIEVELIQK
ncbi:MAG: hypothetical protein ACOX0W_03175 [Sphaerochaetaceae bacterium]|jgi:hypothetical protein